MVNLASRTIDENKNILLAHSKKIKKQIIENHSPKKPHETNNRQEERSLFQKNQMLSNVCHLQQKDFFNNAIDHSANQSTFRFENYQPFYNLVFCPNVVQELFSNKNNMEMVEMRQKMMELKTPMSNLCFEKNLDKMKILSSNQDLLIQHYLKDKYTNSDKPNPQLLREYYRYSKAKLSLSQSIEDHNKENFKHKHINSAEMLENSNISDQEQNFTEVSKSMHPWHNHWHNPHHNQTFQNFLQNSLKNPLTFSSIQDNDEFKNDEETKNDNKYTNQDRIMIDDYCKKNEKYMEEFFGSFQETDDDSLKYKIAFDKSSHSWFNDNEIIPDSEKFYSIL